MPTTASIPLNGADFACFIVKVADAERVPRRALLGMGCAESRWRSEIDLWQAVRPDIPFDLGRGIVQFWKQHWKELGSPVGPERDREE